MKKLYSATAAAALFVLNIADDSSAKAATVLYSATVNLKDSQYTIINTDGVQLFLPGFYQPGSASINLHPGDVLNGTVSFGGDRLRIAESGHANYEILTFYPFISSDLSNTISSGSMTLLGVTGHYAGPSPVTGNIDGAVLGGYHIGDLTPSFFSFNGIQFTLNYEAGSATAFDPYVVAQFSNVNGSILSKAEVPEPATWSLMIFGLGAIGATMRRNRKSNGYSFVSSLN